MNKTIGEALDFIQEFRPLIVSSTRREIVIAPPFTALRPVAERLRESNLSVAAQDIAAETDPGAFTGEVSGSMIAEAGASHVIIGHSERRQYYCETDESVNKKTGAALHVGLIPIVCVGERLEERDAGRAEAVVGSQLARGLANLTPSEALRMILAYEPVWAIGTGRTATPDTAEQMHSFIRSRVQQMFGDSVAEGARILYGGSVKPDNVEGLIGRPNIDGALVGGACLEAKSFAGIVNVIIDLKKVDQ
ncbi:MAG: triose-phosphate isomerase [Blastocatellia bacterium AA13]|nr:MAG: triose-phosphate isomerase [Blastocatellia bacterium AA13]